VLQTLTPDHLPVLVIAPKRVAEHVWGPEVEKWEIPLSIVVATGGPAKREAAFAASADITVIGRDNIKDVPLGHFKTIVIDELSGFKDRGSVRWKMARRIQKDATYVWGLTGTPAPNGLIDLWAQLFLLDQGERLGTTLTGYRERYFSPGRQLRSGVVTEWNIRPEADKNIHVKIGDICLSMKKRDYLPSEPPDFNDIVFPLDRASRRVYDEMRDELVAFVTDVLGTDIPYTAANAAVLSGKLSQITGGFLYPDEGRDTMRLHREKVDILKETVDGTGSPVVAFYHFQEHRDMILKHIKDAVHIDAKNSIQRWNAGDVPVLLAHPKSAGHGLNLQHGGHTIVWSDLTWSLDDYEQGIGRLDRQGQENRVMVHRIIAEDSVDGEMVARLEGKKTVQDALMAALGIM